MLSFAPKIRAALMTDMQGFCYWNAASEKDDLKVIVFMPTEEMKLRHNPIFKGL